MTAALLIIDIQNDFLPPNGSLAVSAGDEIINPVIQLARDPKWACVVMTKDWHPRDHISFARNHNLPDFSQFTYESPLHDGQSQSATLWPVHCVQDTVGSEVPEAITEAFERLDVPHTIVNKGYLSDREYYSGFNDIWEDHHTELNDFLKSQKTTEVYVVGLALDYCVKNTAISASKLGYHTTILQNYTRAIAPESIPRLKQELSTYGIALE